jgi:hypothetical protein
MSKKNTVKKKFTRIDYIMNSIVKVFIIVAIIIAALVLIMTFINVNCNQQKFTHDLTETLDSFYASGNVIDSSTNDLLTLRMQYLEKLSEMHKQASSNDLFVFMYGFLSSVLIGVSAYMVKKGQGQLEKLSEKYDKLDVIAKGADERLDSLENSIHFNVVSKILSDALMSILSYNISFGNGNLTRFKQSLRDASDLLCKSANFSKFDESAAVAFERTLETIEGVYDSAAKKQGSEIDYTHKDFIEEDFRKIRKALTQRHNKR